MKINVIRHNAHKYSVSAMCDVLNVKRSTYYYQLNRCKNDVKKADDVALSNEP